MREELETELSDRLGALEGWPVSADPEPIVWAEGDDDDPGAAAGTGQEPTRPSAERS
ncbi:MAG TPA: hypothetical protein VFR43_05125 [Gaiellaceae bacterium]|nr:hypothetical protein [Gaiellaceae bacterium]